MAAAVPDDAEDPTLGRLLLWILLFSSDIVLAVIIIAGAVRMLGHAACLGAND